MVYMARWFAMEKEFLACGTCNEESALASFVPHGQSKIPMVDRKILPVPLLPTSIIRVPEAFTASLLCSGTRFTFTDQGEPVDSSPNDSSYCLN